MMNSYTAAEFAKQIDRVLERVGRVGRAIPVMTNNGHFVKVEFPREVRRPSLRIETTHEASLVVQALMIPEVAVNTHPGHDPLSDMMPEREFPHPEEGLG